LATPNFIKTGFDLLSLIEQKTPVAANEEDFAV
jgi:hypothetical protein